jgi:hypothetical protein
MSWEDADYEFRPCTFETLEGAKGWIESTEN